MSGCAELQVTINYSFLRGASHPEELFAAAKLLGMPAMGIVDRNSVAGIVRCWEAARTTEVRLVSNLDRLRAGFRDHAYLALTVRRRPGDAARLCSLKEMARAARVATLATGDVLFTADVTARRPKSQGKAPGVVF